MKTKLPLFAILAVYFLLGLALIIRVPLNQAPDEAAHWQYVEAIVAGHSLPVFEGQAPPLPGYEFHQPPLYYLLCAPGWAVLGPGVENYFTRIVSLLCGAVTIGLIWAAVRTLFPRRLDLAVLAAGLASVWPAHLGVSAVCSNDSLAGVISAWMLYLMAKGTISGWGKRTVILTGIAIGAGLLTKTTTAVLAVAALGCIAGAKMPRSGVRSAALAVVAAGGIGLLVASPWLARNQLLYGDPLGLAMFQKAASAGTPGFPLFSQAGMLLSDYFRGIFVVTLTNTWGIFGGPDTASRLLAPLSPSGPRIPGAWPQFLLISLTFATALTVFGLMRAGSARSLEKNAGQGSVFIVARWWAVAILLVVVAWLQFSYGHFSGGQARYLHAGLLPVCVGFAVGWTQLWGPGPRRLIATGALAICLVGSVITNLLVWRTLV